MDICSTLFQRGRRAIMLAMKRTMERTPNMRSALLHMKERSYRKKTAPFFLVDLLLSSSVSAPTPILSTRGYARAHVRVGALERTSLSLPLSLSLCAPVRLHQKQKHCVQAYVYARAHESRCSRIVRTRGRGQVLHMCSCEFVHFWGIPHNTSRALPAGAADKNAYLGPLVMSRPSG